MKEEEKLILVIGEKPSVVPNEFSIIEMYYRKKDKSLEYYGTVNSMFNFNHVSFLNVPGDPRYYFEEGHSANGFKFRCELKVVGSKKGLYRLIGGYATKIATFTPICELKNKKK